jgi:hypothetical protein
MKYFRLQVSAFRLSTMNMSLLLVLALVIATPQGAGDKPDFSGYWILESQWQPTPDIPRALSVHQSLVRTNVYGQPMTPFYKDLTVERASESATRSDRYEIGVLGGVVGGLGNGSPPQPQIHFSVAWNDQALVMKRGTYTGPTPGRGDWTERREVWSLDREDRIRVTITTRGSAVALKTIEATYRRN